MRKNKLFAILFIISVQSLNYLAVAQTVDDAVRLSEPGLYSNARSMSLGNSYSTIGNDYSAILYNPATLGLTEGTEFTGSINYNFYTNDAQFLNTNTAFTNSTTTFNQAGIVFQLNPDTVNSFAIALGYTHTLDFNRARKFNGFNSQSSAIDFLTESNNQVIKDLGLSYPTFDQTTNEYLKDATVFDGNLNQTGYDLESGGLNVWSFGTSYEFAPNIYLGGSINYTVGSYLGDSEYIESDSLNMYSLQTDPNDPLTVGFRSLTKRETREWTINGYDFRFGILYKLWNFIGVSLSFKTPTHYMINEKYSLKASSEFAKGYTKEYDEEVIDKEYEISTPYEFTVGAMVNLWIITGTAQITYTDYSQIEYAGGLEFQDQAALNKNIKNEFGGMLRINGGAEFRLPWTGISARAGAMIIQSPDHNEKDFQFDKKYLNVGLGLRSGDDLEFDITYSYGWWDVINENYGSDLSTVTDEITVHNIIFTTSFRL